MRYPLVQRGLIALVLVLAMAVWFSASAVVPALASQWHLSAGAAAWMTAPVQAGFVLGAVGSAVLGLADRIRPHLLVAGCAAGAAGCTLLMALFVVAPHAIRLLNVFFLNFPVAPALLRPCPLRPVWLRRSASVARLAFIAYVSLMPAWIGELPWAPW